MYKEYSVKEELIEDIKKDKHLNGSFTSRENRYPIRFILFDNFQDSYEFVSFMQSQFNCIVKSINDWVDNQYSDAIITHSRFANKIKKFIENGSIETNDYVITSFSELTRFYENSENNPEFYTLISTIKGIESNLKAFNSSQRIYIPIVGLEGKFSKFINDTQIVLWYFKNTNKSLNYQLIITNNTFYRINGLDNKYTVINNIQEWLNIWRNTNAKQQIISTSPTIFSYAKNAQPDNAFDFCICDNVYEFLTKGLDIDLNSISYNHNDNEYWLILASKINILDFEFNNFFNKYFDVYELQDYKIFIKKWFDSNTDFDKWLLSNYYIKKFTDESYIYQVIKKLNSYSNSDFIALITLVIFNCDKCDDYITERLYCLKIATYNQVTIIKEVQIELRNKLSKLAEQRNYSTAIRFFSPLTVIEKSLAISWLSQSFITKNQIIDFFPDLYYYLESSIEFTENKLSWLNNYFDLYKHNKIENHYSDEIHDIIDEKNSSPMAFNQWYHHFKTVKTILNQRTDIQVYYWIDGLGADWIPYIRETLNKHEDVYLNEVYIARATLPTTTSANKTALLEISDNKLIKIGDLDKHAHQTNNKYPNYIINELEIVKNAILEIVNGFTNKKIAILSDHGLTSLSQYRDGLNLAGFQSDHYGRLALNKSGKISNDKNYIALEDGKTVCALSHESLCGKIPIGQSAHGGCTPEEILVPILIISSEENPSNYSALLISDIISGANPVVKYEINGLSLEDNPCVIYNGIRYNLNKENNNTYYSDKLNLTTDTMTIDLHIGSFTLSSNININLGAEEDDLLNF